MTQTNPEQWAVELVGTVLSTLAPQGDMEAAALAIQAAFAEREARLVEAAEGLLPHISHSIGCAVYQQSYVVRFPDCTCGADAARATLAALKDRTHG